MVGDYQIVFGMMSLFFGLALVLASRVEQVMPYFGIFLTALGTILFFYGWYLSESDFGVKNLLFAIYRVYADFFGY